MKAYKKYKLTSDITLQLVSYTDELMVARVWFSGKGFDDPDHHHLNQEIDTVISGKFAASVDEKSTVLSAGESVHVRPGEKHSLQCLTPTGEIVACWSPARKDIIEKYAELED